MANESDVVICGYKATPAKPVSPPRVAVVALIPMKKLSDKSKPPV
tara:strand:+ start:270 stop:404 length:135 start_codon:yes stop_codon:yes gene_type:complete